MAEQIGFRLYFREGIRRILEPRLILMHLPRGVLVTTTCFSALWRNTPTVGLEVCATGLEIAQDEHSVVLSIRERDESIKRYASVSRNAVIGITDLEDKDVIPKAVPSSLFGKPDPRRFFIRPLQRTTG